MKHQPGQWVYVVHYRGWDLRIGGVHVAGIRQPVGSHNYTWHLFHDPAICGETRTLYAAQRQVRRALTIRPAPAR